MGEDFNLVDVQGVETFPGRDQLKGAFGQSFENVFTPAVGLLGATEFGQVDLSAKEG